MNQSHRPIQPVSRAPIARPHKSTPSPGSSQCRAPPWLCPTNQFHRPDPVARPHGTPHVSIPSPKLQKPSYYSYFGGWQAVKDEESQYQLTEALCLFWVPPWSLHLSPVANIPIIDRVSYCRMAFLSPVIENWLGNWYRGKEKNTFQANFVFFSCIFHPFCVFALQHVWNVWKYLWKNHDYAKSKKEADFLLKKVRRPKIFFDALPITHIQPVSHPHGVPHKSIPSPRSSRAPPWRVPINQCHCHVPASVVNPHQSNPSRRSSQGRAPPWINPIAPIQPEVWSRCS